ncbi:MAG: CHASE2 domain-containing protein, partial [Bacteroidetes bacterium]|nr:CHASE2 domain-containing protein [Bacteroidota bacterium]
MKHIFNRDNFLCTIFVFLVVGSLALVATTFNFDYLSPISKALMDYEFTDLAFSKIKEPPPADTNIVLVNIGNLSRNEIAKEVEIINKYEPKVIGIDAFFKKPKDESIDSSLESAFSKVKNLVLVSKLIYNQETNQFDTLQTSLPRFNKYAKNGYANFITGENNASDLTTREFYPRANVSDSTENIFAAEILKIANPKAYEKLEKRNNEYEIINWRGNIERYYHLDVSDVFNPDQNLSFLKNKIVLMGYMGETMDKLSLEDIFFSPLNHTSAGRTFPDIYGIVIHANIISMISAEDYIFKSPRWLNYLIAILIGYFNIALFMFITKKYDDYFDLSTRVVQIIQTIGFLYLELVLISKYQIKIDFLLTIVVIVLSGDLIDVYHDTL